MARGRTIVRLKRGSIRNSAPELSPAVTPLPRGLLALGGGWTQGRGGAELRDAGGARVRRAAPGRWPSFRFQPARQRPERPYPAVRRPDRAPRACRPRAAEPGCEAACDDRARIANWGRDGSARPSPACRSERPRPEPWLPAWPRSSWLSGPCPPVWPPWPWLPASWLPGPAPRAWPRWPWLSGPWPPSSRHALAWGRPTSPRSGSAPRAPRTPERTLPRAQPASAWRCADVVACGEGWRGLRLEVCRSSRYMIAHRGPGGTAGIDPRHTTVAAPARSRVETAI